MIGSIYLTPEEKSKHVDWHETIYNDDPYAAWCMKLLVNGNYENFKGYEHKIRPSREDYEKYLEKTLPKEYGAHITIALPKPTDKTPVDIKEKLATMSSVTDYYFSYEFYSDDGNKFNPHIHLFLYGHQHKGNIIKLFRRFFKIEPNFVDFKMTYNKQQNENVINYIKGKKKDEDKQNSTTKDQEYRIQHDLEDFYHN